MALGFAPPLYAEDFRTFWSAGTAWGGYFQRVKDKQNMEAGLNVASGELKLKEFSFTLPPALRDKAIGALKGTLAGKALKFQHINDKGRIKIVWEKPVLVKAGEVLSFEAKF
jgi:hypothetical protein